MKSKKIDQSPNTFILVFETGDELAKGLLEFANHESLSAASFKAVGALSSLRLGWFSWDNKKGKILGPVTVVDGKSALTNLKSDGTNCGPPQLKGEYEQFQYVSQSMVSGEQVQLTGTRTFPAAMVSNYPGGCSMRAIAGGKEEALLWVTGMSPQALGMPIVADGPIAVSADRKSFSVKAAGNWVWTYTPTVAQ